mgnify:CR=1 FL=1
MNKTPIYPHPAAYARENGELEQYRASQKALFDCKCAIDDTIRENWDGMNFAEDSAKSVLRQFGPEKVAFILAYTVRERNLDNRFSGHNASWANTVPLYGIRGRDSCILESHPAKVDLFIDVARKCILELARENTPMFHPLKREEIKAEAQRILTEFQKAQQPNSPNGTHYMAQISQDFLARASSKDHDRLMAMLPFQSLAFSSMVGRNGLFALISKDEDRTKPLRLRKPSVRRKLQEQPDAPKPPSKGKATEQEL